MLKRFFLNKVEVVRSVCSAVAITMQLKMPQVTRNKWAKWRLISICSQLNFHIHWGVGGGGCSNSWRRTAQQSSNQVKPFCIYPAMGFGPDVMKNSREFPGVIIELQLPPVKKGLCDTLKPAFLHKKQTDFIQPDETQTLLSCRYPEQKWWENFCHFIVKPTNGNVSAVQRNVSEQL